MTRSNAVVKRNSNTKMIGKIVICRNTLDYRWKQSGKTGQWDYYNCWKVTRENLRQFVTLE